MRKIVFPIVAAAGFALSPIVAAQSTEQPADTEQAETPAEPAAQQTAEPAAEHAAEPAAKPAAETARDEPAAEPNRSGPKQCEKGRVCPPLFFPDNPSEPLLKTLSLQSGR